MSQPQRMFQTGSAPSAPTRSAGNGKAATASMPRRRQFGGEPAKIARAALVTGCSSGIGHAAALRLHETGYQVYATARRLESVADLAAAGISTMRLDVTDDESMQAVVSRIVDEHGAVGILVNNAGFELAGPVEEVPLAEARRQFDTNLFGLARLTQLVIPGMRVAGGGRIINLSSVFGLFGVPGNAYYAASKHAVAGFTDSLRRELAGFGIQVVLIEPTAARTSLNANTTWPANGTRGPYGEFRRQLADWHAQTYAGPPHNVAGRLAVTPGQVAAAITKAATRRRPRARYPVGILARGLFALRRWLPTAAFDAFVRTQFPAPRQPSHQ